MRCWPTWQRDPADQMVCLGDAIQGGPQPAETVARLRELGCPVVMGNADAWLLSGEANRQPSRRPRTQERVRAVVAGAALAPPTARSSPVSGRRSTLPLAGDRNLLCFHGSPDSFDEIILPDTPEEDVPRLLGAYAAAICCRRAHPPAAGAPAWATRFFFNPGSVGLAYNRHQPDEARSSLDPWAEYAVLTVDNGRIRLELRRAPFDLAQLIAVYRASGRPHAADMIAQYAS